MRLRLTIIADIEIGDDLSGYPGAKTLADAASLQRLWIEDGTCDPTELLPIDSSTIITVEPVEE